MRVIDLTPEHQDLFCVCLEDWSDEAREAGPKRAEWTERVLPLGMRAKLAVDDDGEVGAMIQYLPIEHSFLDGEDLYVIHCVWVHSYKEGRGDFRKQGMGTALLEAAEEDARALGAKGIAAWGLTLPIWMKASWFRKHGYEKADSMGGAQVVWKRFTEDAVPPRWFRRTSRKPELVDGKVTVTALVNGWCMAQNLVYERAKRAADELGERVVFREIDLSSREAIAEWGVIDAVFIDHDQVNSGPPPSYEKVKGKIEKRLAKL